MKTAIVTGITGCVGRHVKEKLLADGWDMVSLTRDVCRTKESITKAIPPCTDALFHCAGTTSGDFKKDNIELTDNLIYACRQRNVYRFIFTSTAATYAPNSCEYAHSKWIAENLVRTSDLDAVILQPCVVIGRYDRRHYSQAFTKKCPVFHGSMEFCWADDVATAHLLAYEKGKSGESYLLPGTYASWLDFAREVAYCRNREKPTRPTPLWMLYAMAAAMKVWSVVTRRPPLLTPATVRLITSGQPCPDALRLKTANDLGYSPTTPLSVMVRDCHAWMKKERML